MVTTSTRCSGLRMLAGVCTQRMSSCSSGGGAALTRAPVMLPSAAVGCTRNTAAPSCAVQATSAAVARLAGNADTTRSARGAYRCGVRPAGFARAVSCGERSSRFSPWHRAHQHIAEQLGFALALVQLATGLRHHRLDPRRPIRAVVDVADRNELAAHAALALWILRKLLQLAAAAGFRVDVVVKCHR